MSIAQLKRSHWLLISIIVGLGLWGLRRGRGADISLYGEGLTGQSTFEQALLSDIQGIPQFKSIQVHRAVENDGAGHVVPIDVVAGKFCHGAPESDGKYHWHPFVFIARVPYQPTIDFSEFYKPGVPSAQARWAKIARPTVVDFLGLASDYRGVQFTWAWWNEYPFLTFFGGSLLLIGVVWPCVIDLLVYGKLVRPREEKGIDLSKVKPPAARPAPAATQDDLDRLHALEEELEHNLADGVGAPASAVAVAPPPVRQLAPEAQAVAITDPHDAKNYRRKADDFYPTEERSHKPAADPPIR